MFQVPPENRTRGISHTRNVPVWITRPHVTFHTKQAMATNDYLFIIKLRICASIQAEWLLERSPNRWTNLTSVKTLTRLRKNASQSEKKGFSANRHLSQDYDELTDFTSQFLDLTKGEKSLSGSTNACDWLMPSSFWVISEEEKKSIRMILDQFSLNMALRFLKTIRKLCLDDWMLWYVPTFLKAW